MQPLDPASNTTPLVIRRRPGRPRLIRPVPDLDEYEYAAKLSARAQENIRTDAVVVAMEEPMSTLQRLDVLVHALAIESAGLLYDRERLQASGRDGAPQICSRRIDALMKLAHLVVDRELLRREAGEMDDDVVLRLIDMLVDAAVETITEVAPADQASAFTGALRAKVAGASWSASTSSG